MRRVRSLTLLSVMALATTLASAARAEPSVQDKAQATRLFDLAMVEYKAQRCREALPLLEASQRLDPSVGALMYAGECFRQVGMVASAWGAFREAARLANRLGDRREKVAGELASEIGNRLSFLSIEVPAEHRADGLVLKLDGKVLSASVWGVGMPVDPGPHKIEFSAPDREGGALDVVVVDGGKISVAIPLLKPAAAGLAPAGRSLLVVQVLPEVPPADAEVRIDGQVFATADWDKALSTSPGEHTVAVSVRCRQPVTRSVSLPPGQQRSFVVSLPPPLSPPPPGCRGPRGEPPSTRPLGLALAGVGLALGGAGGVLVWRAIRDANDAVDREDLAAYNRTKAPHTAGLILFGVGGAAALTGVTLALYQPRRSAALGLAPVVGRGGGGVWLSGSW